MAPTKRFRPALQELERRIAPASFKGLGALLGPFFPDSYATAVSADGTTVVGQSLTVNVYVTPEPFRWTEHEGMVGLGLPSGHSSGTANDVSADGSIVVGHSWGGFSHPPPFFRDRNGLGFRWDPETERQSLGALDLPGDHEDVGPIRGSNALAISADGSTIVGHSNSPPGHIEAVRWTASGIAPLGYLDGLSDGRARSVANAVSADGKVIVGYSNYGAPTELPNGFLWHFQAFRWTPSGEMTPLPLLPGLPSSFATDVSANGETIIGYGSDFGSSSRGFRWTVNDGLVPFDSLPGMSSVVPTRISANGASIIGSVRNNASSADEPFLWTQSTGVRLLRDVFVAAGLAEELTGWSHLTVADISAAGNVLVGAGVLQGRREAWIARLDETDLKVTALDWNDAQGGADFSYEVTGTPLSADTTVQAYWAVVPEGEIPGLAHRQGSFFSVAAQKTVDTHGPIHVPQASFANAPPGVTHIIVVADPPGQNTPNGAIAETNEANNFRALAIPKEITSVTTTIDEEPDGAKPVYGTYLSGISIDVPFSIRVKDPLEVITAIDFDPGNGSVVSAEKKSASEWTVKIDPGDLDADEHSMVVTAQSGSTTVDTFDGTIKVIDKLSLDFEVDPGIAGTDWVNIEDIRLVHGIALSRPARAKVADLPFKSTAKVYNGKFVLERLAVKGNSATQGIGAFNDAGIATFNLFSNSAPNVPDAKEHDYEYYLAHNPGELAKKRFTTAPETLFVTPLPAWMANATGEFRAGPDVAAVFDPGTSAYVINAKVPQQLQFSLPDTKDTPFHLFNGLKTNGGVGFETKVYARLREADTVELDVESFFARATVVDKSVLDLTVARDDLDIKADLKSKTLDLISGIQVTMLEGETVLDEITLLDKDFDITIAGVDLKPIPLKGALKLVGGVQVKTKAVTAQAGVHLIYEKGKFGLNKDNTFFTLNTGAHGEAFVGLNLEAEFLTAKGTIELAEARVIVDLTATLDVHFGTYPASAQNADFSKSKAQIAFGYSFKVLDHPVKEVPGTPVPLFSTLPVLEASTAFHKFIGRSW